MQPYHAVDDGRWADRRLGAERAPRDLRLPLAARREGDARLRLGLGRRPALADPRHRRRRHARARSTASSPGGWVPEQKIAAEEALRAYTVTAAYAAFEEKEKGSLEIGKLADFVVLSDDPLSVRPEAIEKIQVDTTVVGGRVVYQR